MVGVAQLAELQVVVLAVAGSSPVAHPKIMSLSLGIVGLPNVGKSTLFTALTNKKVEVANYPFATIDPNVGIVEVPDERLDALAQMSKSVQTINAAIEFIDIAGLVKGASGGAGLGNQFLSHIRETDAIIYVVRDFESKDIQHTEPSIDAIRDSEIVRSELAIKDIETIEKRISTLSKELKAKKDKELEQELEILQQWQKSLDENIHIYQWLDKENTFDRSIINKTLLETQLLTSKPAMYVINAHEKASSDLIKYIESIKCQHIALDARAELETAQMTSQEKKDLGIESALPHLIQTAYKTLNLISFFTTGEKETRAWTTTKGSTAPQAGKAIHSDFHDFFIRAEVVNYKQLLEANGWVSARKQGIIRIEGKEYIVQDGDVIVFLHNPT